MEFLIRNFIEYFRNALYCTLHLNLENSFIQFRNNGSFSRRSSVERDILRLSARKAGATFCGRTDEQERCLSQKSTPPWCSGVWRLKGGDLKNHSQTVNN